MIWVYVCILYWMMFTYILMYLLKYFSITENETYPINLRVDKQKDVTQIWAILE